MNEAVTQFDAIVATEDSRPEWRTEMVAIEEPLEIRLGFQGPQQWTTRAVSITMRTPGHDQELAAGFLLSEGIVRRPEDIAAIEAPESRKGNIVRVDLAPHVNFDPARLDRHFYTTSSCGVCGKSSLEALQTQGLQAIPLSEARFSYDMLWRLPSMLRMAQTWFEETGGLHAAGLFSMAGELLIAREDVGRHNAVDKALGAMFLKGQTPLTQAVLLVSGRTSFELAQKALAAGVPILAAVGAPSSLAVELAREFDLTLAGFLRDRRCNVYSGGWRIQYETEIEK